MLTFPDRYPETLQLVAQAVYDYLVGARHSHQSASEAAFGAAECVRQRIGGSKTYIGKGSWYESDLRAAQIYTEFNGRNIAELARKYSLSEERIRQICAERLQAERAARQGSIFPEGDDDEQDS